MRASREHRQAMVRYAHAIHQRGWVANHDGNLTARLGADRFLATPTATSKADVSDANLIEVDGEGKRVAGTARPFGELGLHLAVYHRRADVQAVVHAHPPHATALACSGRNLIERPFIAEAVVSLGPVIPLVPFASPGKAAVDALGSFVDSVDAALLEGHGVLTWGPSLELAYLRMELVEHLARIALLAEPAGGVRGIADEALPALLASRAKAGLGAAADKAVERYGVKTVAACAPAPHSRVAVASSVRPAAAPEVVDIIRQEIIRSLKDS